MHEIRPAKLHIVIPSYQNPALLSETLKALIRSLEIELRQGVILATCVDDASPQSLESVVRLDGGGLVEYVRNDKNLGIIPNFNYCINLARAPLMVLLGADDLLLPSYWPTLEAMVQRYPEASVYAPGVAEVNTLGRRTRSLSNVIKRSISPFLSRFHMVKLSGSRMALRLAIGDFLYFPSLCWKTEDLRRQPFDPRWLDAADWHRLFVCALMGKQLVVDNQTTTFLYRRHPKSASEVAAKNGFRFTNERALSLHICSLYKERGWWLAALMCWLHPTIRMNAMSRRVFKILRK